MLLLVLLLGLQYYVVVFCLWDVWKNYVLAKNTGFGLWNVCTSSVSAKSTVCCLLRCLQEFNFSKIIQFFCLWNVCTSSVSAKNAVFFFWMFAQVLLQQKMTAIPANLKSEMGMEEDEDLAK